MNNKIPKIVALLIGRAGSTLKGKNIRLVAGKPLLAYQCIAARQSHYISNFFVSSDDEQILTAASQFGYQQIWRPSAYAQDNSSSCDVIVHALEQIKKLGVTPEFVVLQHSNSATVLTEDINNCIQVMLENHEATCCAPMHENPEYHPYRSRLFDEASRPFTRLVSAEAGKASPNRQFLPVSLFFDHTFWVIRANNFNSDAPGPWPCMGNKIIPYRTSFKGFDVHDEEDLRRTEEWVQKSVNAS